MLATRRVCRGRASPSSGDAGTLLPPRTFLGLLHSAFEGGWALTADERSREAYERLVRSKVIQDGVLMNAPNGTLLTYALFHELQNPLLCENPRTKLDVPDFLRACQPALENFHVVLGQLRNRLAAEEAEPGGDPRNGEAPEEAGRPADRLPQSPTEALFGANRWRSQAADDPDSLAAAMSRMTTDACFDALYYTSKLNVLAGVNGPLRFHDSSVSEVALLGARAEEVRDDGEDEGADAPYNEFQATDDLEKEFPVAAQMDVLFEVTHTFKEELSPEPGSDSATASASTEPQTKELSVTSLAVAVFEGWLYGGSKHRDRPLRWRLAAIREAYEFPQSAPLTRQ